MNVEDLTVVAVTSETFSGSSISVTEYLVPNEEVDRFVQATLRLRHEPGVNPHNGNKTTAVRMIQTGKLESTGPFWWTTPDLQQNGDPAGARLWQILRPKTVWIHPDWK